MHLKRSSGKLPDAIYIPFYNRYANLNGLLSSLRWFDKDIFILVSDKTQCSSIDISKNKNIHLIHSAELKISKRITNLKTFKNSWISHSHQNWDLPLKRNIALLHSLRKGFHSILLIDDDVYGITRNLIAKGVAALGFNHIAGCRVKGFPDTSVIGHIEQQLGEPYFSFLSGNFLFISPAKTEGFFPLIYNEDWLFMIPSILKKKVVEIDSISQKKYDPFDQSERVQLQEFGEIIAEGLFELISRRNYVERFTIEFWREYLQYRRSYVSAYLEKGVARFTPLLKKSLSISKQIDPTDCVNFLKDWERDIITFKKLKSNEA
jgi:hypothetical protein